MTEQDQIDAIIMDIHEASMSSDPKDGCEARIAKALLVPFARVVTEEQERGSSQVHIHEGVTRALLAIHLTALIMAEKKSTTPDASDHSRIRRPALLPTITKGHAGQ